MRQTGIWVFACALALSACSTLPPGSEAPRHDSWSYASTDQTSLGTAARQLTQPHQPHNGFVLLPSGLDGLLVRLQLADAAEQSLDLQYFIFRSDASGRAIGAALWRAAERGVRIRILLDDGETVDGDEQIALLDTHPLIEVRIFNPFAYRGHTHALRVMEYLLRFTQLDYRMHNKLWLSDGAVALLGGRNIGDPYFQQDPQAQFADDDVLTVGPVVAGLANSFDGYWNSPLSIPVSALQGGLPKQPSEGHTLAPAWLTPPSESPTVKPAEAAIGPLPALLSGRWSMSWAQAHIVSDSPDKRRVQAGDMVGKLMHRSVAKVASSVQSEWLMITPYLIPGDEGMALFDTVRARGARVRILTNSTASSTVSLAQSAYLHYRTPLLEKGVEIFEVKPLLGNARGSGQSMRISRHGNYALHAKLFVFDRRSVFIGSMNFDQRSMHLNTEVGLLIDSPDLAEQIAQRFEAMVQPANAYRVTLEPGVGLRAPHLAWHTQDKGLPVMDTLEPARNGLHRLGVRMLSWLPLDSEM